MGHSINGTYLTGPNLYPLTSDILFQCRTKKVGLTADVSKMYREVKLDNTVKDSHRFLVRDEHGILVVNENDKTDNGIKPSSFVATAVLRHHATNNATRSPTVCVEVHNSFYVDVYVSGTDDDEEALQLQESLCQLLRESGMTLSKWSCSLAKVVSKIPTDLQEIDSNRGRKSLKALGIHWDTGEDNLFVTTPSVTTDTLVTKRKVTQVVVGTYDVLGLTSAWWIRGTILLQNYGPKE